MKSNASAAVPRSVENLARAFIADDPGRICAMDEADVNPAYHRACMKRQGERPRLDAKERARWRRILEDSPTPLLPLDPPCQATVPLSKKVEIVLVNTQDGWLVQGVRETYDPGVIISASCAGEREHSRD